MIEISLENMLKQQCVEARGEIQRRSHPIKGRDESVEGYPRWFPSQYSETSISDGLRHGKASIAPEQFEIGKPMAGAEIGVSDQHEVTAVRVSPRLSQRHLLLGMGVISLRGGFALHYGTPGGTFHKNIGRVRVGHAFSIGSLDDEGLHGIAAYRGVIFEEVEQIPLNGRLVGDGLTVL
nr:hypothetical protein [Candidatus Oscillochloris fontis]